MTVKPPHTTGRRPTPESVHAAFEYEAAQEKAAALGRLGRRLEAALAALAAFDAEARDTADRGARRALVAEASVALWHFVVQREALGLRDSMRVMRDYRVPDEVRDRMGAFPPGR